MKYEKSCGAVVYRNVSGKREYLVILNKKGNASGHWGFPKGHTEDGENEVQTAIREIREETGIDLTKCGRLDTDFRAVSSYSPRENVEKDVIFFVAEITDENGADIVLQQSEVADFKWVEYADARETLTHSKDILDAAEDYLNKR